MKHRADSAVRHVTGAGDVTSHCFSAIQGIVQTEFFCCGIVVALSSIVSNLLVQALRFEGKIGGARRPDAGSESRHDRGAILPPFVDRSFHKSRRAVDDVMNAQTIISMAAMERALRE
jgi:hypothetical protein